MKRIISIIAVMTITLVAFSQERGNAYWHKMADKTTDALIENFWGASFKDNPTRYYFNFLGNEADLSNSNYWPQAHAMDVIVDAYNRTGDPKYRVIYPLWWDGLPRFNPNANIKPHDRWYNNYVDDMEWICMTQIRMFESVGNPDYFVKAKQTFNEWIISTWGPEDEAPWYGGITWNTQVTKSKNACSNGPGSIIAAKIYLNYDKCAVPDSKTKDEYLQDAIKIYQWERKWLFNKETGAVADNMSKTRGVGGAALSYNEGTFLGTAHLLYKITGEKQYLEDAMLAADYTIANIGAGEPKHLVNPRTGDSGLFHGIFIRYFVQLINDPNVPKAKRQEYAKYLTETANIAVSCLVDGVNLFSTDWLNEKIGKDDKSYLNCHVSGCTLMEAMCILKPIE